MSLRLLTCAICLVVCATEMKGQPVRVIPRPPAQAPGPPKPEDGGTAPDGYAPLPEWLGQTRAPRAATTVAYDVETVVEGLAGAFCFSFLPDGRIIVGERPGRIRIVGRTGSSPSRSAACRRTCSFAADRASSRWPRIAPSRQTARSI